MLLASDHAAQIIAIASEVEVEPAARSQLEQLEGQAETVARGHQRGTDRGGTADFVGLRGVFHPARDEIVGGRERGADRAVIIIVLAGIERAQCLELAAAGEAVQRGVEAHRQRRRRRIARPALDQRGGARRPVDLAMPGLEHRGDERRAEPARDAGLAAKLTFDRGDHHVHLLFSLPPWGRRHAGTDDPARQPSPPGRAAFRRTANRPR
jgi:hypothetical protein